MSRGFQGNVPQDDVISENGEGDEGFQSQATGPQGARAGARSGNTGVIRPDTAANILAGRGPIGVDRRKYKYDVLRGRGANIGFAVTRDDRMPADEAGAMLHAIHEMFGVAFENADILQAFDSALWFCHTVNGGSTLNPGRSTMSVPGVTQEFDYARVRDKLGTDMRRFFRAYADDITEVNKRVIRDYDAYDDIKREHWGWLMSVAHDRGLSRYPHLAHDSADACLFLSSTERQALQSSKALVIGSTPNAADRMMPEKGGYTSQDRYNSSTGSTY